MRENGALTLFFILFMAFILSLTYIFFHMENLRIGYMIEDTRKERDKLKEEIEILEMESAKLRNLKRVEKIARELGMKEMEKDQIVVLSISEIRAMEEGLGKRKIAGKETDLLLCRMGRR